MRFFVVFEGVDKSGKSTHAGLTAERLRSQHNLSAELLRFPDRSTAIGQLIDSVLKKQQKLEPHALHLLFSANRWEIALDGIECQVLIVDRYVDSGTVYATAQGLDPEWCRGCDNGLPEPDLVFYCDKQFGGEKLDAELFETCNTQARVYNEYEKMRSKFITVDTQNRTIEENQNFVCSFILKKAVEKNDAQIVANE